MLRLLRDGEPPTSISAFHDDTPSFHAHIRVGSCRYTKRVRLHPSFSMAKQRVYHRKSPDSLENFTHVVGVGVGVGVVIGGVCCGGD